MLIKVRYGSEVPRVLQIIQAETQAHLGQVKAMFNELVDFYRTGIDAEVPDLNDVPAMSGYEEEFERLPGKYAPPDGRLLIALYNGDAAGCIGLKKLDDGICELKRLWVRPNFRGHKIGQALVEKLINEARETGYHVMLLETEISLKSARAIYEAAGFEKTEPYFDGPEEIQRRSLFMRLAL
jgi:putative acetyltransferase